MLTKLNAFLLAHKTAAIYLLVIAMAWHLGYRYENLKYAEIAAQNANAAVQQQLQAQVAANQKLAGQTAELQTAYDKLASQITQQNASIKAAIAATNTKVAAQQKTDATLPLDQLAVRWRSLENLMPEDVQLTGADNLSISGQASVRTVQDLESIEPLHQEVMAGHQIEDNLTKQITSLNGVNDAQASQITGLASQIKIAATSCQDQIAVLKTQQKKRSSLWFKIGAIAGAVITGLVLR